MIAKNSKALGALLLGLSAGLGYLLWLSLRPVEIVAVHHDENYSSVLVRHFPFTDKGKIVWWLENKAGLKKRFNIPRPAFYGSFTVNFWDFGEGYKKTMRRTEGALMIWRAVKIVLIKTSFSP